MNCPCNGDCKCPSEQICNNGDCKKNYVVVITAKWCRACSRMEAVVEQLRRDGYIVYVVDVDEAETALKPFKITFVPTTLVFDAGKEVKRFVGVTPIEQIKDGLQRRNEQEVTPPSTPDLYDFR